MAKQTTPIAEKQYYVLIDNKDMKWKAGDVILLPEDDAVPYIRSRQLLPLMTAILTKRYKPDIEIATYGEKKTKPVVEQPSTSPKKILATNHLRTAIQEKKSTKEMEESEKIEENQSETSSTSEPKELETPSDSKTTETSKSTSSSSAEDAIKAKIAAAKAKKK
jgi:hypothetical protein